VTGWMGENNFAPTPTQNDHRRPRRHLGTGSGGGQRFQGQVVSGMLCGRNPHSLYPRMDFRGTICADGPHMARARPAHRASTNGVEKASRRVNTSEAPTHLHLPRPAVTNAYEWAAPSARFPHLAGRSPAFSFSLWRAIHLLTVTPATRIGSRSGVIVNDPPAPRPSACRSRPG
jgi:hypothetical protein